MGRAPILPAAGLLALLGCTPPLLRQAEADQIHTGRLAFLADGRTTREEVLLRLGTPSARFEGERVLTYAFRTGPSGDWIPDAREIGGLGQPPEYRHPDGGTHNLVLVFGTDARLLRHSLVMSR